MKSKRLLLMLLMALLVPWAAQAQKALPYSYGFENNDLAAEGWTTANPYNSNASEFGISTDAKNNGTYGFRFSSYNRNNAGYDQYLFSPQLNAANGVVVRFYYKASSSYGTETFKVGYSKTDTNVSSFTFGSEISTNSTTWAQSEEFTFPAGTKYVAIYYYSNYQYRLYVDDFSFTAPPSCVKPTNLEATLTPGNGTVATLNWTAGGTETNWVLEYGTASDFTGATSVNVSGTPTKDLTGLTAETKYYARVKADCGGGDESEWSATCEFTPTDELIINIFGQNSSTSYYLPSQTNYDYSYTQQIYTATEMGGFPCTLKSVAFKGNNAAVCDLNIYLVNTNKSSFTSTSDYIAISDATLVFSGEVTFTANDWKTIEFDNDFDYEGGNLAVIVDDNSGNWTYSTTTWQAFSTTTAQALYFYQDDTNVNPSSPSADYSGTPSVKNQIKFSYELPSPYTKPQNLAVTSLAYNSATLTWEAPNSDVQSYKYQYRVAGGEWNALTSTNALSAPLSGLTGNTAYEFQVQAIYAGNNESAFASTSFTTPCDAYSIDPTAYFYGFETAADMDCWTLVNGNSQTGILDNNTWNYDWNAGYDASRTGDYFWFFNYVDYDNTNPDYQTLISPELTDLPANGVHVEFYYRQHSQGEETFRVGYSTTDKNLSSFTWGTEITNASTEYQRFSANYPQETKYVAIQHMSDDQYYLFLDDFTFEGAADCLEPTNVLADNITTTGADITWTNGGEETAWDIYVTTDATAEPNDGTTPTYHNISTKPYPIASLTPATTYYVYVRGICRENSAWSTPAIFHTECVGMDLPYGPYGFEDGALSVCWNVINTNTSYNSVNVGENNANTGTHSLAFFRGSNTGDLVAVLPEVGAYDLSDYQFEFSAKGGYAGYEITIGIMTDPEDLTTFVAQGDVITTTTSYAEYKVRFNEYTGSGKYVAIKVVRPSSVNYGSVYVDDIAINPIPACIEPEGLTVTQPTPHGATFSWTAGAATQTAWQLYISEKSIDPADDETDVIVADANPFTLTTGLNSETPYYVWVRANCGGTDGFSMWVGPETFTTGIACPAPTGLVANNVTSHTADLSWQGTSESYVVSYRTAAYYSLIDEDFNSLTIANSIPEKWDNSEGTTATASYKWSYNTSTSGNGATNGTSHDGSKCVRFNSYSNSSNNTNFLKTPSMNFPAGKTMKLSFWWKNPTGGDFSVYISTDGGETKTAITEGLTNQSTWKQETFSLTDYIGASNVTIHFKATSNWGSGDAYIYLDDVKIGEAIPEGEWLTVNPEPTAAPVTLTGLLAERKYEAKVQGNCGSEGMSQETTSIFFTTDIACPAPTGLQATNPKSNSIDLSWTNGGAEDWIVAYKKTADTDFTEVNLTSSDVTEEAGLISYTLSRLEPETDYTVKVRDNCEASYTGDGVSEWTTEVAFSTIAACSAMNPVVSNITHHNATVTWDGESNNGYTVKYREAATINEDATPVLSEQFGTSLPTGWENNTGLLSNIMGGSAFTNSTQWYFGTNNGVFDNHARINIYGTSRYGWLITPEVTLGTDYALNFDLALTAYSGTGAASGTCTDDRFVVLVYADNVWHIVREWNNSGSSDVYNNIPTAGENITVNLSAYNDKTVKIAFYGESTVTSNGDNNMHIDNVIISATNPAEEWQNQGATTNTASLTGLIAGTQYDVKVVPNCDETLESNIEQFTTLSANDKYFLTAGDWATAANWLDEEMPAITDNAIIKANTIINNGTVATAKKISFQGSPTPTLTIENGGQLQHDNTSTITATVKKTIAGYGEENFETNNGYVLFAPPFDKSISTSNSDGTGLRNGTYDLYSWSRTARPEWINYGANNTSSLSMSRGTGYLYANQATTEVTFTGSIYGSGSKYSKSVYYTEPTANRFQDWNLIGNPFVCNAYLATETGTPLAYYKMNAAGNDFEAVTGDAIAPMEGVFYQATEAGSVYFFRALPAGNVMPGNLNINLTQAVTTRGEQGATDNAIIRFGEGNTLGKFSFREGSSKIYIPMEGKDYAVVNAESQTGEIPVNFKAETNGSYSLSFTSQNVTFSYLHLIDNLTGNDVNLLDNPSYSFDAQTTDYAQRFRLVFATGSSVEGDNFGFINGMGNLCIFGIEGEATVQVIDVLGHVISSDSFSGSYEQKLNVAPGVYMIRLINGNDVKVQKIIVR